MTPESMLKSPCNGNCGLAMESGSCPNCFRTMDEIVSWRSMSEEDRAAVVAAIPARRAEATATAG